MYFSPIDKSLDTFVLASSEDTSKPETVTTNATASNDSVKQSDAGDTEGDKSSSSSQGESNSSSSDNSSSPGELNEQKSEEEINESTEVPSIDTIIVSSTSAIAAAIVNGCHVKSDVIDVEIANKVEDATNNDNNEQTIEDK